MHPPQGGGLLGAVACTSASACTAVGWSSAGTLAERWDGTRWTIQATPNPLQGAGVLSGVACTSASACTAVGATNFTPGAKTLAERWDGTRWSIQPTPNPPQGGGVLASVACTSASACTAVGASTAGTLAERWDGTTWSIQATPNPPQGGGFLNGVACTSASACIATGGYQNSSGAFLPLAERWNGSNWAIQPTPPGRRRDEPADRRGVHLGHRLPRRRVLQPELFLQPVPGHTGGAVERLYLAGRAHSQSAGGGG